MVSGKWAKRLGIIVYTPFLILVDFMEGDWDATFEFYKEYW